MADENVVKDCPCPSNCKRHGKCYECVPHHIEMDKNADNYLPYCFRPKEKKDKP
jgi:hypothetical protein